MANAVIDNICERSRGTASSMDLHGSRIEDRDERYFTGGNKFLDRVHAVAYVRSYVPRIERGKAQRRKKK